MFEVKIFLAFGTGAMQNPSMYWSGLGRAFAKSPKQAYAIARRAALKNAGEGSCWVPIVEWVVISRNGVEIYSKG